MQLNYSSADATVDAPVPRASSIPHLHVLTLTPFFPSLENETGGCFVREPLDALAARGVASSVIAVSPIYNRPQHSRPNARAQWVRYPQVPGTLGLSRAGRFLSARLLGPIRALHSQRPIDVIHAHAALPCGQAAFLLARHLRIPYIVTVHGLDVFNSCFREGAPAEWRRRASVCAYQGASTVICVSGKVQEILQGGMPSGVRSSVVYNGTDPELFSPDSDLYFSNASAADESQQEILAVGNLLPSKGHELVLRAIHRIRDVFSQLHCRFIGEGPEQPRLVALANQLGIRNRVYFVGRQNRAAVAAAMRRCSAFVLPSRSEGLGCVYLEAMSCGKPAIACRGQGIEEIIGHQKNGWLIPPGNLDELAHALTTLLSSPGQASQIGLAARQRILDGLTLSHQAQNLATLYRQAAVAAA